MADIELVINLPEEIVTNIRDYCGMSIADAKEALPIILNAIHNGTPLPKGHGRLIDGDALGEELHRYTEAPYQYALKVFNDAPTIIEADKEE